MDKAMTSSDVHHGTIERMMKQYGTSIYRMCLAYLRDRSLAEDAMQDTFLKAYKKLGTFRSFEQQGEKAWLTRIAINTCKDYRRSAWFRHMWHGLPMDELPAASYEMNTKDYILADEIIKLPIKLKEVVLLFYYQEMAYEEIAEALGISRSTVANRLADAKERLKNKLERWYADES